MSGGFSVRLPAVDELSARVSIAGSDVRSALGHLQLNACLMTDSARLSAALDGFSQFWQGAVQSSASAIDATSAEMAQAAVQYGTVDSTVMVDPSLTKEFVSLELSGNSGLADTMLGPLLPNAKPDISDPMGPLLPGLPPTGTSGSGP